MKTISPSLLLLHLSLSLTSLTTAAPDTTALKATCGKTVDPAFCESTVQSVAKKETIANATTVLKLTIKATIKDTKTRINKIKKVAHDLKHDDKQTNYLIRSCVEDFKVAIEDLEDAELAMAKGDDIAKRRIRQANGMSDVCQNGFVTSDMKASPIEGELAALQKSTTNLRQIADVVWPGVQA